MWPSRPPTDWLPGRLCVCVYTEIDVVLYVGLNYKQQTPPLTVSLRVHCHDTDEPATRIPMDPTAFLSVGVGRYPGADRYLK